MATITAAGNVGYLVPAPLLLTAPGQEFGDPENFLLARVVFQAARFQKRESWIEKAHQR